jgi:hypothetical protein
MDICAMFGIDLIFQASRGGIFAPQLAAIGITMAKPILGDMPGMVGDPAAVMRCHKAP